MNEFINKYLSELANRGCKRRDYILRQQVLSESLVELSSEPSSDFYQEEYVHHIMNIYENIIESFGNSFQKLEQYLYDDHDVDNIINPFAHYAQPDIQIINEAIKDYIESKVTSKFLGLLLLRCYLRYCIRVNVEKLFSYPFVGHVEALLFCFMRNKPLKFKACALFTRTAVFILSWLLPPVLSFVLLFNDFNKLAYGTLIFYLINCMWFLVAVPWWLKCRWRVRRERASTVELINSLKSICDFSESEIFDYDDLINRVKNLYAKYPTLHTPELIPLLKTLSSISNV